LCKSFSSDNNFTLHDVGCGLGHFNNYIKCNYPNINFEYSGFDVVNEFVSYYLEHFPTSKFYNHDLSLESFPEIYDYMVIGGVFYRLYDTSVTEFSHFMKNSLMNGFK
jgi:trans-aconitate methyltransferase